MLSTLKKRNPYQNCCLCTSRIPTNSKKRPISSPFTLRAFQTFLGSSWSAYSLDELVCSKCYTKIVNRLRVKSEGGKWTVPEGSPGSPVPQYSPESSVPQDSPEFPVSEDSPESPVSEDSPEFLVSEDSPESPVSEDSPESPVSEVSAEFPVSKDSPESPVSKNSPEFPVSEEITFCLPASSSHVITSDSSTPRCSEPDSQTSTTSSLYHLPKMTSVNSTQSCCFLCRSPTGRTLVPKAAVKQVWDKLAVYVPTTNRCCKSHLNNNNRFENEDLQKIQAQKIGIDVNSSAFGDWLRTISASAETFPHQRYSFEDDGIKAEDYKMLTSLTKTQFDELHSEILPGYVRNSVNRSSRDALGMLLLILRKNLTQDMVAFFFGTTQPVVSTSFHSVKKALLASFVPKNLGVHHITRKDAAEKHGVEFFNKVFEKPSSSLPLVLDATYLFIEKPSEIGIQKMTFSPHKHRSLLKVMFIVCPDGYIIAAFGPYFANGGSNDANILKLLFHDSDLPYFTDAGDFYLVDRGFRDALEDIRDYEIDVYMHSLLPKDQKQFNVEQAADSRKVTSCRWVIEAVNGRLKNVYKFFSAVIEGGYTAMTIFQLCQIGCALLNKFRGPLLKNQPKHNELARRILQKSKEQNTLKMELDLKEITTRFPSEWTKLSGDLLPQFPRLSMDELITFACGIYQIRMGQRYIEENSDEDGNLTLLMHKEEDNLYRMKISSRFQSCVSHQVFVKLNPAKQGLDCIEGYVCDCRVGLRVVGSCSHVAAVIRYLCHNQYQENRAPKRRSKWEGVMDAKEELKKYKSQ